MQHACKMDPRQIWLAYGGCRSTTGTYQLQGIIDIDGRPGLPLQQVLAAAAVAAAAVAAAAAAAGDTRFSRMTKTHHSKPAMQKTSASSTLIQQTVRLQLKNSSNSMVQELWLSGSA
jgi:branched-subunit amino acid ABC-type transport system permease component